MIPVARRGRIETACIPLGKLCSDPRRKTGKNRNYNQSYQNMISVIPVARRGRIETCIPPSTSIDLMDPRRKTGKNRNTNSATSEVNAADPRRKTGKNRNFTLTQTETIM